MPLLLPLCLTLCLLLLRLLLRLRHPIPLLRPVPLPLRCSLLLSLRRIPRGRLSILLRLSEACAGTAHRWFLKCSSLRLRIAGGIIS